MSYLKGKKTYILAAVGVVYAITGVILGHITPQEAYKMIWASLTVGALRNALE